MKKKLLMVLVVVLIIPIVFVLVGCNTDGKDGLAGRSAYEIWLDAGHTGTEQDFLDWLKGGNGQNGKSAFDLWLEQDGNTGKTMDDFWNWLREDDRPCWCSCEPDYEAMLLSAIAKTTKSLTGIHGLDIRPEPGGGGVINRQENWLQFNNLGDAVASRRTIHDGDYMLELWVDGMVYLVYEDDYGNEYFKYVSLESPLGGVPDGTTEAEFSMEYLVLGKLLDEELFNAEYSYEDGVITVTGEGEGGWEIIIEFTITNGFLVEMRYNVEVRDEGWQGWNSEEYSFFITPDPFPSNTFFVPGFPWEEIDPNA